MSEILLLLTLTCEDLSLLFPLCLFKDVFLSVWLKFRRRKSMIIQFLNFSRLNGFYLTHYVTAWVSR